MFLWLTGQTIQQKSIILDEHLLPQSLQSDQSDSSNKQSKLSCWVTVHILILTVQKTYYFMLGYFKIITKFY